MKTENVYSYTAIFYPAEEGGYTVTVPALPGCISEGDTLEEARWMIQDAIQGYLEVLIKDGEEIPIEPQMIQEKISIPLPLVS